MGIHYFLKCSNCGYLTEVTGENHNWCYNCTKRFPNYYKLWRQNGNGQSLEQYQLEMCKKYEDAEIKSIVNPRNKKLEIKDTNKELITRRRYIKEGIPLDRGGHMVWSSAQIKMFYIPVLILAGIIILVMYFLK